VAEAWSAGPTASPEAARAASLLYTALALAGCLVLVAAWRRRGSPGALRALLMIAVAALAMALLVLRTQDFHPRYYFAALPALYLAVAAGIAALPRPAGVLATALVVLAALPPLWNLHSDPRYQKQDYRAFIRPVEIAAGREDTVLFLDGPSLGLAKRYRLPKSPVKIVDVRDEKGEVTADEVAANAVELSDSFPHLWLADNGAADGHIRAWLDAHAFPVGEERAVQDVTLRRYYTSDRFIDYDLAFIPAQPPDSPLTLVIRDAARLVRPGAVLPVALEWTPRREPTGPPLRVSVRVVPATDGAGEAVATDQPLHPVFVPERFVGDSLIPSMNLDRHALLAPRTPGTYRLEIFLYQDPDPPGPAGGEPVELGRWAGPEITVEPAQ
jgi:hypothetical protein